MLLNEITDDILYMCCLIIFPLKGLAHVWTMHSKTTVIAENPKERCVEVIIKRSLQHHNLCISQYHEAGVSNKTPGFIIAPSQDSVLIEGAGLLCELKARCW